MDPNIFTVFAVIDFIIVFAASLAGTRILIWFLRSRAILDHPNERSSHAVPTPRGGGLIVIALVLMNWVAFGINAPDGGSDILVIGAVAAGLAALSWMDDLKSVPVLMRLLGQGAAVAVILTQAPEAQFFQGLLPPVADKVMAGILWVWFINLFNFMDGIDGMTGVEAISVGIGVAIVAAIAGLGAPPVFFALSIVAACLGFLWWNWSPAKIFLGDVGSVPLGFLLGWLLLLLAAQGQWAPALILPLYYLVDATVTLVRRILRREKFWQPHREHFYQRAVQRGLGHGTVTGAVLIANLLGLGWAALAALDYLAAGLAGAAVTVAALVAYLIGPRPGNTS